MTSKKNGRFPKFVFLALFLPMAALLVVVGISLDSLRTEARINEILDDDSTRLHLVSGFLGAEVFNSLKHLHSLSTEDITLQAMDSRKRKHLRALEASFLTLAQRNPHYQQIRWLDEAGRERARIIHGQEAPYVVPAEGLQDKSSRYYFEKANTLLPGELYISRLDLNIEQGQVEMPLRPVLRIATPVRDRDRKHRGIIVINIDMEYLFNLVGAPALKGEDVVYFLINQQGVLLNGDARSFESADALEESVNFPHSYPALWAQVASNDQGSLEQPDGLWSWETLSPVETFNRSGSGDQLPQHLTAFDQLIANDFSLTLMAHRPLEILNEVRRENHLLISLLIIFILSLYAMSLFFYLAGQTRARRAEVDAAYAHAQTANMTRMKELEERFHRLVEASSIGQMVVDSEGRIEISNPAAERMLGYERGELEGLRVDVLLPAGMQEKHVKLREQYMQAPEARRMGVGRELEAVRKDGTKLPVEVGLNPYTDHERSLVLASIIDLSDREGLGAGHGQH